MRKVMAVLALGLAGAAPATHPGAATRGVATQPAMAAATTPAVATSAPASQPADLSTPQSAVISFLNALGRGDEAGAKETIAFGGGGDEATATLFLRMMMSTNDIQRAANSKFGSAGNEQFGDPAAGLAARVAEVKRVQPVITNDAAAITLAGDDPSKTPTTIALKRVQGQWKLDAVGLFHLEEIAPEDAKVREELARKLLVVNGEVAGSILGGKYASAQEAAQDLWKRSNEAARAVQEAATRPAAAP